MQCYFHYNNTYACYLFAMCTLICFFAMLFALVWSCPVSAAVVSLVCSSNVCTFFCVQPFISFFVLCNVILCKFILNMPQFPICYFVELMPQVLSMDCAFFNPLSFHKMTCWISYRQFQFLCIPPNGLQRYNT